jgi:hypothetical protein
MRLKVLKKYLKQALLYIQVVESGLQDTKGYPTGNVAQHLRYFLWCSRLSRTCVWNLRLGAVWLRK